MGGFGFCGGGLLLLFFCGVDDDGEAVVLLPICGGENGGVGEIGDWI